ncbi:MAG: hypothetical protein LC777_11415 [Actinobacteria bacterium]|nr:hypothetical protein [Actinomycetota bacterium]
MAFGLLSLLVAAGVASATHNDAPGPRKDIVRGNGAIETGPILVALRVNARSGPSGENPRGQLTFRGNPPPFGAVDIKGRVTCLRVTGKVSTVGFVVTKSRAGFPEGSGGEFTVVDGDPGAPDMFEGRPTPAPPTTCPPPFGGRPITRGDFVVHDATPRQAEATTTTTTTTTTTGGD